MENVITIQAKARSEVGKKISKRLRRQEMIPAIIYGGKKESIPVAIKLDDVKNILRSEKGENTIIRIQREKIVVDAMIKETQMDYLSDNIIHVDFIRLDFDKAIYVNVPVVITGDPIGVKVEDGIFDFMTREIKVKCLPVNIPKEIVVEIDGLHIGDSIKVDSIEFDDQVSLESDPLTVICAVTAKKVVEEEEVVEEVEGEELEADEDEDKKKDETEDKKKAEKEEKTEKK